MAEALSVMATIVAVLQLTSVAIKCINSWSKKSKTVQNLDRELESLHTELLGLLENSKQQPKQLPALQSLDEPGGLFDQAQKTLERW
jgi:hypothetical protein